VKSLGSFKLKFYDLDRADFLSLDQANTQARWLTWAKSPNIRFEVGSITNLDKLEAHSGSTLKARGSFGLEKFGLAPPLVTIAGQWPRKRCQTCDLLLTLT